LDGIVNNAILIKIVNYAWGNLGSELIKIGRYILIKRKEANLIRLYQITIGKPI
jgi:hypothetical protein